MSRLFFHTHSGLCNRLRALFAARAFCRATDRQLCISWPKDKYCSTMLRQLFKSMPGEIIPFRAWARCKARKLSVEKINAGTFVDAGESYRIHATRVFNLPNTSILPEDITAFCPTDSITDTIENITEKYFMQENVVPVIIRWRHAHAVTYRTSHPNRLIAMMRDLLDLDPTILFFLLADCTSVSRMAHDAFPKNCMELPRSSYSPCKAATGIVQLTHMYLAARTPLVLVSAGSSIYGVMKMLNPDATIITPTSYQTTELACI